MEATSKPKPAKKVSRPSYLVVLLLILLIFPVLIAQTWFYVRYAREALQSEQSRTLSRARTLAAVVARNFESDKDVLQSIADRPSLRQAWEKRDMAAVDWHLQDAKNYRPEFIFAAMHDVDGTVRWVFPADPIVGANFAYRDWYRGVTTRWRPYVSEVYRTRIMAKELVVAVALPVRDSQGQPIGILMAAVSLKELGRTIEGTQEGVIGEPYIVDQRGHVVAPTNPDATEPVTAPESEIVQKALAGEEVSVRTGRGMRGYVLSAVPIAWTGWAVLYRRPTEAALANVLALRRDMGKVNAYLLLLFLGAAALVHFQVRRQRKLHDSLEESEERHRLLFQEGPQPMWVFDLETLRFLDVNDAAVKHYGYTREEFLAMTVKDIRPAEDVPALLKNVQAHRRKSHTAGGWRHRKKNGVVIDVEVFAHHIEHRGRTASLVLVNDVTERKGAEDALRASEQRTRLVVESALNAFISMDESGCVTEWNPQAAATFGWQRHEAIGRGMDQLIIPERYREAHGRGLRHFLATGEAPVLNKRLELSALKRNGEEFPIELTISAVRTGASYVFHAFLADITERKRAQDELARSRKELQDLLDGMTTMVAMVDVSGRFLKVNQIAQDASGMPPEELMKTHFLEGPWWTFDAEVQARVRDAFESACRGERVNYEEKLFGFGKIIAINFSMTPVAAPYGDVEYIVAEGRDVTPLKEAEEALRQRTQQLEAANQELEGFTYSVSHDLRAPLRHISGFASIIQEDYGEKLPPQAGTHFQRIVQAAAHMGRLIDDLLNLARVSRKELARQPTDLDAIVKAAMADVEREAAGREIEWRVGPLPQVSCDPGLARQVFVNLLSNSVKYSRPRAKPVIEVGQQNVNGDAALFVRDNGVGFDMKYAHKLFGVFQRLHHVEDFEGTGVGLATVHRIVHKHGGRIWAEAGVDQGATFYFTLGAGEKPQMKADESR